MATTTSSKSSASAAMWTCELSGEPLGSNAGDDIVVTPSGHVCKKKLLLTKLAENGGRDPFVGSNEMSLLSEEQLVTLQRPSNNSSSSSTLAIMPPRPHNVTSMPSLLTLLEKEYEALTLELYDTRKALEETRRELSHALYQNDAALRVVARVSMERDAAKQELQHFVSTVTTASASITTVNEEHVEEEEDSQPPIKRHKPNTPTAAAASDDKDIKSSSTRNSNNNAIPNDDLQDMIGTWQELARTRKARKKTLVIPSLQDMQQDNYWEALDKHNWQRTRSKPGIVAMKYAGGGKNTTRQLVTSGRDKQLVVYDMHKKQIVHTIHTTSAGLVIVCLDVNDERIVAVQQPASQKDDANAAHLVQFVNGSQVGEPLKLVLGNDSDDSSSSTAATNANAVDVSLHPTGKHVVVTMDQGCLILCRIAVDKSSDANANVGGSSLQVIATLVAPDRNKDKDSTNTTTTTTTYSSGVLHPDGLIAAAGTSTGAVHLWDFKNQALAETLESEDTKDSPIVAMAFSNNGYHLAVATESVVQVWDIRKAKIVNTLQEASHIHCVTFDESGKYLAFGGKEGVSICTTKEGTPVTTFGAKNQAVHNIVWTTSSSSSSQMLITSGDTDRQVRFYGPALKEGDDAEMKD